jgi:hypothetical protein
LRRYRFRGGTAAREPRAPPRAPASFRRGVRRIVPWRARPDVIPFEPGVSAGLNGVGVEVLKGPQRLAARVPGRQQQAWREPVQARSTTTDGARRGW